MIDRLIPEIDKVLRTLFAPATTSRAMPGEDLPEADLSEAVRRHAAALMRINHCGEICAQALYQGQSITSRQPEVKKALAKAA
ncbi:MAG: demethoxyubiquinone hydroxylase family protein, partial [Rugosibacter sp.]|nr:demethoxyubiquinone hydroxylase family protein [Rugosibacter sp.]